MTKHLDHHLEYSHAIGANCTLLAMTADPAFDAFGVNTPQALEEIADRLQDELTGEIRREIAALGYTATPIDMGDDTFLAIEPADESARIDRDRLRAAYAAIGG